MTIKDSTVLVLGGWGLVGTAVCRKLLEYQPRRLVIASLTRKEAESACAELRPQAGRVRLEPAWGNIFVRTEFKDLSRADILEHSERRMMLARDVLERTVGTEFHKFFLYELITRTKPDIIVDCVNSATGLAYQDIYSAGLRVLKHLEDHRRGAAATDLVPEVEKMLCSLYLPQLVRHVQVLDRAMRDAGVKSYLKVGTSGTGGMGLNIPYTHSEDKPSRVLLSKSSVAGAHSLLLFLMGRTPGAPATKEVKPATAIAWKRIGYGEILRGGKPIPLYDCPLDCAVPLKGAFDSGPYEGCRPVGENLIGVFIDTGENGTFSIGEFAALSACEQMEFITPEEIAQTVIWELEGAPTGHDIVSALDAAVLGPTYRAGVMRSLALEKMRRLAQRRRDNPVAFELLGPPRLSKLLYEAHLLKTVCGNLEKIIGADPVELSRKVAQLVSEQPGLRSRIISIGIPILLPDGKHLLRGPTVKVPDDPRRKTFEVSPAKVNHWADAGWVDLRAANMRRWQKRLKHLLAEADRIDPQNTSSQHLRTREFWKPDQPLDEGEVVGWVFITEDRGQRIK